MTAIKRAGSLIVKKRLMVHSLLSIILENIRIELQSVITGSNQ